MRRVLTCMWLALVLLLPGASAYADTWTDYSEIETTFDQWQADYPNLCMKYDLGTSVQGRHLWALRISDNMPDEEDEPEFKYISTMHGDEIVGTKMCMMLCEHLLTNYGSDPQATNIVNEVDLWIIPLMNPDGYDRSPRTRTNANGVDLNRDFPDYGEPNDSHGRELETQRIMTWDAMHTFTCSANLHCGTLVVNYPFDNYLTGSNHTPDEDLMIYISEEYSQYNLPMWNGPFYHGITNGADWYVVYGCMQDWNYVFEGCNETTIEISMTDQPPASTIPTYWEDNRDSMLAYIETCLIGVRGLVTGPSGEPLDCTVRVVDRDHDIFTDPQVGDYHRMLMPGTYDLEFDAGSYGTQMRYGVVVNEGPATVLHVSFGPGAPITQDVSVQGNAGEVLPITLIGSDPNGDPIDFIVTTLPQHGSLSDPAGPEITSVPYTLLDGGDVVDYLPDAGYVGEDYFEFMANDGGTPPDGGDSNVSIVSIVIEPGAPVITTQWLLDGALGEPYAPVQLEAEGGQLPLNWSVLSGDQYMEEDLGSSQFELVGTAQGWNADDNTWDHALSFDFPFYGVDYSSIRVCSNGFVYFGSFSGNTYSNSSENLRNNRMIAPLWDDLRTDNSGYDIYLDESVAGQITVRWDARTYSGGYQVNTSVTLVEDGTIRFHYGSGNTNLTPTVGISNGDGVRTCCRCTTARLR